MNARPSDKLAIAVAQLNSTVGDTVGNAEKVRRARVEAAVQGADLVVFPELFIAGYPPEDLVLKPAFQAACRAAVEALARETASGGPALVVPNGSPYWRQKGDVRLNIAVARVTEQGLPTVYVNQVGAQDELVFDGVSFGLHADCSLAFQLAAFQEAVVTTHWQRRGTTWRCEDGPMVAAVEAERADYAACVLDLRDYVNKNGFPGVVLGLSGGIDSA